MIIVLIFTGIRRGELCGLEWQDFDFDNKRMKIVRSSQYIGNKTMMAKDPKTKSGIRELSLSQTVINLLHEYRLYQLRQRHRIGDSWNETDRLFTQWNGMPIHPDTVTDWFGKFLKRNNFPKVVLHSLRHTNANIYTHAIQSADAKAAEVISDILNTVKQLEKRIENF